MRIDGLPNQPRVSQTNQSAARPKNASSSPPSDDVVEISQGAADVAELSAAAKSAEVLNPRLEEIKQKVNSGHYDSQVVREQIADRVLHSRSMKDVVDDIVQVKAAREQLAEVPDVREERVDQVRRHLNAAGAQFYDQTDVRRETIDGFLDEIA